VWPCHSRCRRSDAVWQPWGRRPITLSLTSVLQILVVFQSSSFALFLVARRQREGPPTNLYLAALLGLVAVHLGSGPPQEAGRIPCRLAWPQLAGLLYYVTGFVICALERPRRFPGIGEEEGALVSASAGPSPPPAEDVEELRRVEGLVGAGRLYLEPELTIVGLARRPDACSRIPARARRRPSISSTPPASTRSRRSTPCSSGGRGSHRANTGGATALPEPSTG
jgi:hypothetical protein